VAIRAMRIMVSPECVDGRSTFRQGVRTLEPVLQSHYQAAMGTSSNTGAFLAVAGIGAVTLMGYLSLRERSLNNRDDISKLQASIVQMDGEIVKLRTGLERKGVVQPEQIPQDNPPLVSQIGAISWRLPDGWPRDLNVHITNFAETLAPAYDLIVGSLPPTAGRAIVARVRMGKGEKIAGFEWVKGPTQDRLRSELERLLKGVKLDAFPAIPEGVSVDPEAALELTFHH
jgi:hypothetical protein